MTDAVLGKTATLHFATAAKLVDLTPDFGRFSFDGTADTEAIEAAERDAVERLLLGVDHSIGIDSLRWGDADPALELDTGSAWDMVATIGGGAFRSLIRQPVLVKGNGTSTPTDNLVEIDLVPEANGPWHVGLGHLRPGEDDPTDAGYVRPSDATGAVVWTPGAGTSGNRQQSSYARSPSGETHIAMLVLGNAHGASTAWRITGRRSSAWATSVTSVNLTASQFNKPRITVVARPANWAGIDVDWRLDRLPAAAGAPAAEIWLLGSQTKGG